MERYSQLARFRRSPTYCFPFTLFEVLNTLWKQYNRLSKTSCNVSNDLFCRKDVLQERQDVKNDGQDCL